MRIQHTILYWMSIFNIIQCTLYTYIYICTYIYTHIQIIQLNRESTHKQTNNMAFTSLKPLNLILFDTYLIGILYLGFTWQHINCQTNSNIWQLFFYLLLFARLIIDQLRNNQVINGCVYSTMISSTSLILVGMSIYQSIAIAGHQEAFDRNVDFGCFQNRIILVADCIVSFLLVIKDVLVIFLGCCKTSENKVLGDN